MISATLHIQEWCFKTFLSIFVLSLFSPYKEIFAPLRDF